MAERPEKADPAGTAIAKAEHLLAQLEGSSPSASGGIGKASGKAPKIENWKVPIGVIGFVFSVQAAIAALVDNETIGSIFAVGAVIVAVLTAIVAALSSAQQSSVPFKEFETILREIIAALKAVKNKTETGDDPNGGSKGP